MHRTQKLTVSAADLDDTTPIVTPADVLRGAARYLELHGWIKSSYYGDTSIPFPPACADGAIGMAAFGGVTTCPGRQGDNPDFRDYNRAYHYFRDYLDQRGWKPLCDPWCGLEDGDCLCNTSADDIVFLWNDDDQTIAEDVVRALCNAADEYDWQHASKNDLETYADICAWREEHPDRDGFLAWLAARQ
jgi:hypothetical protein